MFDFLELEQNAFGLDLSDRSMKVVNLKKKGGDFQLSSFGSFHIEKGLMENGEIKKEKELAQVIKNSLSRLKGDKLKTNKVVVSLPEEKVFLQVIQMPKMKIEEVAQAIRFEAEKYIPIPSEKVYLDFSVVKPVVDSLDHQDIIIVALPKEVVDSYFSLLKRAGLEPVAFEIEPESIARAVIKGGMTKNRVLILDMGATRTKIIVFAGYSVRFISSSLVCGSTFDSAISKKLNISLKEAKQLKEKCHSRNRGKLVLKNGKTKKKIEEKIIFEALIPPLTDLLEQIKNYIDYYCTHAEHEHIPNGKQEQIGEVILCGGGADMKNVKFFFSEELGVPVKKANPWINISLDRKKKLLLSPRESLAYTTALGLALRGAQGYD